MSRILLLLIFLLWMACADVAGPKPQPGALGAGAIVFLGCYALLVLLMRTWSGVLARRVSLDTFDRKLRRFNKVMLMARVAVPTWLGIATVWLGWGSLVAFILGMARAHLAEPWTLRDMQGIVPQLPGLLLGTLPAFGAWVGLWWAQYPAENALREQNILLQVESGLPIYKPPGVREYIMSNLRMQVLFTIVPILLIMLVRDVAAVSVVYLTGDRPHNAAELIISVGSAGLVFLLAPEILRRVLHTQPLPDSPLRRRLEDMCRRTGMGYRDILLWRTQNNMGNAAVMGILPQVRFILLSDLLLERMDDDQIEAVFAHEVGHVVHRHMAWFVVFFAVFFVGLGAMGEVFGTVISDMGHRIGLDEAAMGPLSVVGLAGAFMLLFGYLSRRFERQADVYAARTMEASRAGASMSAGLSEAASVMLSGAGSAVASPALLHSNPQFSHVGQYGATLFASALHRVAVINNMPISSSPARRRRLARASMKRRVSVWIDDAVEAANNWFHGSISHRMEYLRNLSADPALTSRFDRFMIRLYCTLVLALILSAAACFATWK